jgi:hypothetical protein
MENFFPPGFWKTVATLGMIVFFAFGVDLLFGARFVSFISVTLNKKFHVDQAIVQALNDLKKKSDREFDVDRSIMHGWGRFVMGGLLIFGGAFVLLSLLPRL